MFSSFLPAVLVAFSCLASTVSAGKGFTGKTVLSAYFPSYQMAPADVPYSSYTHLDYFVFTTTPDASALSQAGTDDSVITDFVTRAHAVGTTVSYVVGGWTGSGYFSTHVATPASRTTFARTLVAVMQAYNFDGIDIDWEYPGQPGIGTNAYSSQDTANFLLFLQTLRAVAGEDARLSMSVSVAGLADENGATVTDYSGFASVLDYVTTMTYDMTGTWNGYSGPNSPLFSRCNPAGNPYSVDYAVRALITAKFPRQKILIGFPAYSYSYYVTPPFTSTTCTNGQKSTLYNYGTSGATCGNMLGFGPQYLFKDLYNAGYFSGGQTRRVYEPNAATFAIWVPQTQLFIPTENAATAFAKGRYAATWRVAGINVFDASGDTADRQLNQALRNALRLDIDNSGLSRKMAKRHLEEKRGRKGGLIH